MIFCKQCGAQNPQGSKFCSQCAWSFDPDVLAAEASELEAMVAAGQRLYGENKLSDALSSAEKVLVSDPDNIPALALKGDCLERQGDIEGALACYEHVVTLRPDSPLDRIRVAQLRRLAATQPVMVESRPERRNTILAGAAACVLVVSAVAAIVLANKKDKPAAETVAFASEASSRPFVTPAPVPTQDSTGGAKTNPSAGTLDPGTSDANKGPDSSSEPVRQPNGGRSSFRVPGLGGTTLPSSGDDGNVPVTPIVTPEQRSNSSRLEKDPEPQPEKPESDTKKPDANVRPPVIDIKPSTGSAAAAAAAKNADETNEGNNLIRVARQYFLAGDFEKAARAYERAIRLGVSPASANHRLAQCYVNLNRRQDALSAYKRALSSYQGMLNSGTGDKHLVESYMEECRQAIRLLQ